MISESTKLQHTLVFSTLLTVYCEHCKRLFYTALVSTKSTKMFIQFNPFFNLRHNSLTWDEVLLFLLSIIDENNFGCQKTLRKPEIGLSLNLDELRIAMSHVIRVYPSEMFLSFESICL